MIESLEQLRKDADKCIQTAIGNNGCFEAVWMRKSAFINDLDAIEREVEERYIEGPTDKNGDPITYSTNTYQWGALEYIACEMYQDGTHEWFVRGHDTSAPLEKAKHVTVMKSPTVEDILRVFADRVRNEAMKFERVSDEAIAEYAEKLQLKEAK